MSLQLCRFTVVVSAVFAHTQRLAGTRVSCAVPCRGARPTQPFPEVH